MKKRILHFGMIALFLSVFAFSFSNSVFAEENSASHYQETTDYGEISSFMQEGWEDDYYTEAVIDTQSGTVEVDGESMDGDAWINGLEDNLDSVDSVEEFLEEEGKVCEVKEKGSELTVTSPYQSKRLIVQSETLSADFGAEEVLYNANGGKYYLRYATEEQTKDAFERLSEQYGTNVYVDQILKKNILTEENSVHTNAANLNEWGIAAQNLSPYIGKTYDRNIKVAVVDTGCDTTHPIFNGRISADSFDFESNKAVVNKDTYGHGTHVAGILAASTPQNVELMILDVFNKNDESSLEIINTAFEYCMEHDVDLVNCSFGTESSDYVIKLWGTTLAKLKESGTLIVSAAGNESEVCEDSESAYPASFSSTLAVSAITNSKTLANYSNFGKCIDFAAPGDSILSAYLNGTTKAMSGTSMACPNVASALACIKLEMPSNASSQEIVNKAIECVEDLGTAGKDNQFGYGLINLKNLINNPSTGTTQSSKSVSGWKISASNMTYKGTVRRPTVSVLENGKTVEPYYYTISYENNINAGTATVVIKGINGYSGTRNVSFKILPKSISGVATGTIAAKTYTGSAFKPTPSVKDGTKTLVKDKDFICTYQNNVNKGTAKVILTGKGNYTGTKTLSFKINAKKITPSVSLSTTKYTYNGNVRKPGVTVKYGSKTLKKGTDYFLVYSSGRKYVGKYSVQVILKGNYSGNKTVYFKINPKGTYLTGLTAGSKKFTAKWKKQAVQTTGYQLAFRASSASTNKSTIMNLKGTGVLSKTVKNLSANKKYYVWVRTYKTVNNVKYYSAWSAGKTVTTKS